MLELNTKDNTGYTVWVKKSPPLRFSEFFPKRLRIFNQFFTHQLYDPFYTRLQIFYSNISNFDKVMPY